MNELFTNGRGGDLETQQERDAHERGYIAGGKGAARIIMQHCMAYLDDKDKTEAAWRLERADAVAMLRNVCEEYGDNDWPDNLHLADVIEKHLWRNLPG